MDQSFPIRRNVYAKKNFFDRPFDPKKMHRTLDIDH